MEVKVFDLEVLKTINFFEKELVTKEKDYCLTTQNILDKFGDNAQDIQEKLSLLGTETVICRLFKMEENSPVYCSVPKIYRDESDQVKLFDAQNNAQPIEQEIKFHSYQTEFIQQTEKNLILGHQLITITEGDLTVAFKVPFGIHTDFQNKIDAQFNQEKPDEINAALPCGKGQILPEVLSYYPRSVKPMKQFQVGETFSVVENLGFDPRGFGPQTIRYRVQSLSNGQPVGNPFEVWPNQALKKFYKENGKRPCSVISREQRDDKTFVKFNIAELANIH